MWSYDGRLVSVVTAIRETENKMIDAEWEGNKELAEVYKATLEYLKICRDRGDLYVPNF